jgi:glycosyltransferase involved in cell wall biosynthesis
VSPVDVVVPCYNYARYLEACVDSLLSQEGALLRVLVIDDASTDDSSAVAARLAARDSRVEFRRHEKNCGHIATYNEGLLGWAKAKYSLLISADDILAPGALARAAKIMDSHDDVGMVYGMALNFTDETAPVIPPEAHSDAFQVISSRQFLKFCYVSLINPVPSPAAVVRTSMQQQLGGYRPELPHTGDLEMWMRFAVQGPIAVVRAVQAYRRLHSLNMSHNYYDVLLRDCRERDRACREIYEKWGDRFPEFSQWMDAMRRGLAEEAFWMASRCFDSGDLKSCVECLRFAVEFDPNLPQSRMWRRLRIKRLMGTTLWKALRPFVDRTRGIRTTAVVGSSYQIGWWPRSS